MTAIVLFVGASGSGKTHLIERLLPQLHGLGLRAATVKHASHGFDLDRAGSDSWRHRAAGASPVVLVGPDRVVVDGPAGAPLSVIVARHLINADLVLAEGFGTEPGRKVLVHRQGMELKVPRDPAEIIAAVTDESLGYEREIHPDNLQPLADLIAGYAHPPRDELTMIVDDQLIPLTGFVQRIIASSVRGMTGTLKGIPTAHRVELYLDCEPSRHRRLTHDE